MKVLQNKLVIIGMAAIIAASSSDAFGQGVLNEILKRMDMNNKSLQSLKADVTMVKTNTQLGVSDTTTGNTQYLTKQKATNNQMFVRIDWVKPVQEQISVMGDKYELYRPRLNQVIVGNTAKAKNSASVGGALGFMSMSKDQLKANYSVVYLGEEQIESGDKTWHLQLTPKAASSYKMAELWVDGNGMPLKAKIVEQNDDTNTVMLSNIRKNESIKADVFRLSYDKKKVKIIQA